MLVAAACGHDSRLDRADALMYPQPDKALALLDSIDPATLRGEADRARYALLYSQAQNKNHIFPTSDSLIDIAVDYYDLSGHDSLRMLAHFYRSAIRNSAAAYHAALRDGLMAKDIAEQLDMPYWVARASQEIADAYYQSYDMDNAIRYSDIAARDFNRTGYHLNAQYVLVDKASAHINRGHYNEALRILDSLESVVDSADYNICAYIWNMHIMPLNAVGRRNEALSFAYKSKSVLPLIMEPTLEYCDIANLHMSLGQLDSAAYYLEKGRMQDTTAFLYSNSYYLEKKGDYRGALDSFRSYFRIRNKLLNELINNSINVEEKEYISAKANRAIADHRRNTIIIICCAIAVILFFILLGLYLRTQQRMKQDENDRKINDAFNAIDELRGANSRLSERLTNASGIIASQKEDRDRLIGMIQQLFTTQYGNINEVYEKYLESKASHNIAATSILARNINKQLNDITSPESLSLMQDAINLYQNDVLTRMSGQLKLSTDELTLLTLHLAGLSVKTICVILNVGTSTLYSRLRRLRDKVKCSEAPDAAEFRALMGISERLSN